MGANGWFSKVVIVVYTKQRSYILNVQPSAMYGSEQDACDGSTGDSLITVGPAFMLASILQLLFVGGKMYLRWDVLSGCFIHDLSQSRGQFNGPGASKAIKKQFLLSVLYCLQTGPCMRLEWTIHTSSVFLVLLWIKSGDWTTLLFQVANTPDIVMLLNYNWAALQ